MRDAQGEAQWQEFLNCLTTNLKPSSAKSTTFTPSSATCARAARPIRLWCNAASTGEEPYSLAMTVVERLGTAAQARLVCSDVDTKVLNVRAEAGPTSKRQARVVENAPAHCAGLAC